jgi:hypothetical protein
MALLLAILRYMSYISSEFASLVSCHNMFFRLFIFFEAFTVGETPTAPNFYIKHKKIFTRYIQPQKRKKEKGLRKSVNP